jgi:hypothetical protein
MQRSIEEAEGRINELETLVSNLRHGVSGALTPALIVADRLRSDADPRVQGAGERVARSILRAMGLLKASRDIVASK